MKIFLGIILIVFCYCVFQSCKKASKSASETSIVVPQPLPNTVEKTDTLSVMAYNVLNYGNGCQGDVETLNGYFKTIIKYSQPDILSCEKMAAFPTNSTFPVNLADQINTNVLNAVFPGTYGYCGLSNQTNATTMSVLFYNKLKLTYLKMETLESNITDFNMYKLFYNDPNLSVTHDTTFIYVIVNHTQSGSSSFARDLQVSTYMNTLRAKFASFPNIISMGDFNTHNSIEKGYQSLIISTDSTTKMSDPPFYPDNSVKYPAEWESNTLGYSAFLTTSTRALATVPNTCGTDGGAKSWYDHIFISPWLVNGSNYIKYAPNSYQTLGNDGNRLGLDINSNSPIPNNSAPADVLNALFQFSNKYPITMKLIVKANRNAFSVTDPIEKN